MIAAIADALAPQLRPKYLVALEERIYQTTGEDLLLVGGEVVTAIELLSPKNKRSGEGRRVYELKRQRVLRSLTHLVEIDLLRDGKPMPVFGTNIQGNYRILVLKMQRRLGLMHYCDFEGLPHPCQVCSIALKIFKLR